MPQLIQYLCPSWRLSLQGRPSALSRWVDRPVIHYDRAELMRLSVEGNQPETLVWEGTAVELQELQDALQNYIQDLLQRSHRSFVQAEFSPSPVSILPETIAAQELNGLDLNGGVEPLSQTIVSPDGELQNHLIPDETSTTNTTTTKTIATDNIVERDPDSTPESETEITTDLPKLRLEAIGALGHRLYLPPAIELSLTTLECFDLAEVLDQWQTEALSLPPLPQTIAAPMPPWVKTAALILVTVGVSTTVSTVGVDWWRNRTALDVAQQNGAENAVLSPEGLVLEPLDPLTVPGAFSEVEKTGLNSGLTSEVYGPFLPGEAPIALGLEISGEQPLPGADFAGLPAPPPPDFSQLPPPPGDVYTVVPPQDYAYADNYASEESYGDYNDYQDYAALPPAAPTVLDAPPPASARSLPAPASLPSLESSSAAEALSETVTNPGADPAATIATVRSYFQGSWQPLENLTEPLQYQLLVGADGTLQAIIPLGDRAGNFLDRTGMPLLGESLASPGQEVLVTVVLYPDGGVEVY